MMEKDLKETIAENLAAYRKINNLTQAELAEKINYSDKSISKWERGEGLPDIQILSTLANLYGVKVDDFLSKHKPKKKIPTKSKRILIPLMSAGLVWLVAATVFFLLKVIVPDFKSAWLGFIYAIPATALVYVIFTELWGNTLSKFLSVTVMIWGIALSIHLSFLTQNMYLIYVVAMILEVLAIFWYLLRHNIKHKK
jgi:transcriptional regulator with XRE-family HTH domain